MRQKTIPVLLLLILLFTMHPSAANGSASWSPGKLDLTDWNAKEDGTVSLSGQWDFYWMNLVDPVRQPGQADPFQSLEKDSIPVPSKWGNLPWRDTVLSNQGYGTYRLQLVLPGESSGHTMAIYVRGVATAYRLWINGELADENGTVGKGRSSMSPGEIPRIVYFEPKAGSNELVIQVSNFVQRKGGIWEGMQLGSAQKIARERNLRIIRETFIIGCLAVMGLYHAGLFAFRRKDSASLYFGGLCLSITFRTLVQGETLGLYLLPPVSWEAAVKVEYISAFAACYMLVRLVNAQYSTKTSCWTNLIFAVLQGACTLLVLFQDALTYTPFMLTYQLAIAVPSVLYAACIYGRAVWLKKEGSWLHGIGFVLFAAGIANDILYYNQIVGIGSLMPLGLVMFLYTQSLSLSSRFAKAFRQAEVLGTQLQAANESLELKVQERTAALSVTNRQLEEANMELSRAEEFRLRLLSNISHELGTPLTSVKGYARAIMDEVITGDFPRYAGRIYDRALYLERMIDDLVELTKLETRQLPFHYKELEAVPLLRNLFGKYEAEISERGWQLVWTEPDRVDDGEGTAVFTVDAFRLEQVIANLLSNIQKYAPPGGTVRVQTVTYIEPDRESVPTGSIIVRVTDSGPGIPEADRPYIFDRFYRVKSGAGQQHARGAGLGLAICKEIILTHNGEIGYVPGIEGGSTFWFRLPVRYGSPRMDIEGGETPHGQNPIG